MGVGKFLFIILVGLSPILCFADSQSLEASSDSSLLQLSRSERWRKLLHYEPYLWYFRERSLADDPKFFLSPEGSIDAAAELDATIRAFSEPPESKQKEEERVDLHPQCRFPARLRFLREQLPQLNFPPASCPRFEEWKEALLPRGMSIVFPSAYLNNPASMFGHTFLRVDSSGGESPFLGYGVSYAADIPQAQGILFAIKGIFGGYRGLFSIVPYYVQVNLYGDIESRDIWEYELNFTADETVRALEHLWELKSINFDYYFFDENCSYHILTLLEVGRPGLNLTSKLPRWVIPADTVRVMAAEPGLVRKRVYRPAIETTIRYRGRTESEERKVYSLGLAEKGGRGSAAELDLALELLDYKESIRELSREEVSSRRYPLLLERSKLGDRPLRQAPEPNEAPEDGHQTGRFRLGGGVRDGEGFGEIGFRPAYHDLLDPEGGYVRGAQIQFLNGTVRYNEDSALQLEQLQLLDILSLSPWEEFVKPISWNVSTGTSRRLSTDGGRRLGWDLSGGPGLSLDLNRRGIVYLLSQVGLRASEEFSERTYFGGGAKGGIYFDLSPSLRTHLGGDATVWSAGPEAFVGALTGELRYSLKKNLAVRSRYRWERSFGAQQIELGLFLDSYF